VPEDPRPFSPLLREIFDRMPAGVAVFDRDLRVVEWNASFARFLHDNRPDLAAALLPGSPLEAVSPWPVESVGPLFRQALAGETVVRNAAEHPGAEGSTYWDIVLSPLYEGGEVVGVLDTTTDATARVLADRNMDAREEQFRLVFESVSDAVILNDFESGFVADANPAAARMHGYTREEFVGIDPRKFIHPDSLALLWEYQDVVRAGGEFRSRARDIRKDGTVFDVEVVGTGIELQGQRYLLAVVRDISDQVAAEHERARVAEVLQEEQVLLEARVRERTAALASLLNVSRTILSSLDLDLIFERVLDQLGDVVPYGGCTLAILDGSHLEIIAIRNKVEPELAQGGAGLRFRTNAVSEIWEKMLEGSPLIIDDVRDDSIYSQSFRRVVGRHLDTTYRTVRSWLTVPMISQGEVIGILTVSRPDPGAFDLEHANLVAAFGSQVAVAIANARLYRQSQRRAREMEGLASIAAALTYDVPQVEALELLSSRVVLATSAVAASVTLYRSPGDFEACGAFGLEPGYVQSMVDAIMFDGAPSVTGFAFERRQRQVLLDTRRKTLADPRFARVHPMLEKSNWDNAVVSPIMSRGKVLGTLDTYYPAGAEPDAEELRLISAIADQVAVGIENMRLFAESQQRVNEMDALYRADEQLHQSLVLGDVLSSLAQVALDVIHADVAAVLIIDETPTPMLRVSASAGIPPEALETLQSALHEFDATTVVEAGSPRVIGDRSQDPTPVQRVVTAAGATSHIDVSITIGGKHFGILSVGWKEVRRITDAEVRIAAALGQRAAVAIENARLYERSQVAASLEERQRLARELHDSVSQALYGISLGSRTARTLVERDPAAAIEPLEYVNTLAEAGLAELRALIFELRPESLATEGLIAALEKQFASLRARHGIEVDAHLSWEPDLRLDLKEVLYRVGQEAMHNTVKHARATQVTVRLREEAGSHRLEITDNGQGFDTSGEFPGHLGLRSMSERAARAGGRFDIESTAAGTRVVVSVPAIPGHLPGA